MKNVETVQLPPASLQARASWLLGWAIRQVLLLFRRRVPLQLQLTAVECGAACLAMILSYHGRRTTVGECRDRCTAGRDGASARTLAEAARHYGLRVRAFSLDLEHVRYLPLPAIIHWDFNHFVVLERWSPRHAVIADPAVGRRRVSGQEFDELFTGLALTFAPGTQFSQQQRPAHSLLRSYLRSVWSVPGLLIQILGASLVLQLLGLAGPIVTKVLIDLVLPFRNSDLLTMIGIGMILLVLTQVTVSYLRRVLLIALQARVDSELLISFFEHLLSLPYPFFQRRVTGDLLMRLSSNSLIREVLTSQMLSLFLDGAFMVMYLVILLSQAPLFAALVLGLGAVQVAVLMGTTGRVREVTQRDLSAQAESQSYVVEVLSGIAALKASGSEDRALDRWTNLFTKQLNASVQRNRLSASIETAILGLQTVAPLLFLWFGMRQVLQGTLSLGSMLALNAIAGAFLVPFISLVSNSKQLQMVGAHLERLGDVLEALPEQGELLLLAKPQLSGRMEVENLSFRYDAEAPFVLRNISFTIEPRQKVALVGPSGSGKSTLVKVLLGLYPATEGAIRYDDAPIEGLHYRALRSQCGVVLQEPFLFSGSIRQNIAFNDPSLDLEPIIAAAQDAMIHDDISRMPMGYDTLLVEGGNSVSGGQRQRLALARAIAHQPAILMLDEATSHLDVATEAAVDARVSQLACTRIVIAHRLSTIRNADLILVLDNGAIVERGTHEQLVAQGGLYATLVQSQLVETPARAGKNRPAALGPPI